MLTAIAIMGIVSCNEAPLTPDFIPDEAKLVTVHFGTENTDPVSTKATLTPDFGETAFQAAWEVDDVISVYYLNDELTEGTVSATWNGNSFTAELPQYTGEWNYRAAYPVPDAGDKHVDFGSDRTQKGNAYNSKYDIMVGKASAINAAAGKDDAGKDIVFQMERQTAIAYFHFTSDLDEDVTKATLTVSGDGAAIASSSAFVSDFAWAADEDLKSITITFPVEAPNALDFQLWFNVLPTIYDSMTLKVETATKTFTISRTPAEPDMYEAGKLYRVTKAISAEKWEDKAVTPSILFFYESFDKIDGTGANDGEWKGTIASNDVKDENLDNTGWVFENQGGASKCLKLGSGSKKGTATTPSLGITTSEATLWFKAGAWDLTSENTTISLSVSGNGTVTPSAITLEKGAWTEYVCTISGADSETKIVFSAENTSNNRFFLDEVYVYSGEKPSKPVIKQDQTISFDPTSYTATIGAENTYPVLTAQSSGAKTWASSDTGVATIDANTGEITLVAAGTTTISVTVAADETYNEGTGSYELTVVEAPIVSDEAWTLVTDASELANGDVIVIVAASSDYALSTTQKANNRGQVAITKNADNTVTITNEVQQLTLGEGTTTGTFSLSTGDGYLCAASSSSNYLRTNTILDANGSWTIAIASNIATIKANGTNTHNLLKYNSSSKIFSCYSSGQGDVQIYRKNDTRETQTISYSSETGSIDIYTSVKELPSLDLSGVKTSVSYTSSDETVATISETGEITPLKAGTTTITAIAAESADYREARASFVLTVTDSTPFLKVSASKTSIDAAGETITITVDTNVDGWTVSSNDETNFAISNKTAASFEVVVSANTESTERNADITITAGGINKVITLIQVAAEIKNFSQQYGYGLSDWSLTDYSDESSYYKVPNTGDTSIATITDIFTNKTIQSDVVITLNVATYGSGTNPSASTFTIFANSDCTTSASATQSGTLPTSKTYTDVVYTVTKDDAIVFVKDLAIKITKPGKQIRLKSISVVFKYSE